jgi:hypothetical protein
MIHTSNGGTMVDSDTQESDLLKSLARGGLSDQQRVRIERDLQAVRESRAREQQWRQLTVAPHQPRFRSVDAFER